MLLMPVITTAQTAPDSLLHEGTLQSCIQYALSHQPAIQQSYVDEQITERIIQGKLADWFPQLNFNFNVQHNPQLPVSILQSGPVNQGLANTSNAQFSASQTLFNKDVLLASTSAHDVRTFAAQKTSSSKIDVVLGVSKAYYAVLVTRKQIGLLEEAIVRLEQTLKDAYTKYKGGIVDKTDYMRATIALNGAKAERDQERELLKAREVSLKEQMGYPIGAVLNVTYDRTHIEQDAFLDTVQAMNAERRIEFQILQTQLRLQEDNLDYFLWSFLPTVSAYGGYTLNFQNSQFPPLYRQNYPYSFVGLQVSVPIFQGGKRIQQIRQARLQLDRLGYDVLSLRNSINTQYSFAMANYKGSLNNYRVLTENVGLAQDVYRTIQLQYGAGTKSYLEFINAETDLRTAQFNQTNSLYQVLISKLDVEKALGTIQYQ